MKERGLSAGDHHLGRQRAAAWVFWGLRGNLEAAFSPFKGKHSEDSTFSFQSRCRQDFCPMLLSQAVMLLDCYNHGAVVRVLHAELVSKPHLPVPGSSRACSTALGWTPAPCWAVKSGLGAFSPSLCFSSQPSTEPCGRAAASTGASQRRVCAGRCGSGRL